LATGGIARLYFPSDGNSRSEFQLHVLAAAATPQNSPSSESQVRLMQSNSVCHWTPQAYMAGAKWPSKGLNRVHECVRRQTTLQKMCCSRRNCLRCKNFSACK